MKLNQYISMAKLGEPSWILETMPEYTKWRPYTGRRTQCQALDSNGKRCHKMGALPWRLGIYI